MGCLVKFFHRQHKILPCTVFPYCYLKIYTFFIVVTRCLFRNDFFSFHTSLFAFTEINNITVLDISEFMHSYFIFKGNRHLIMWTSQHYSFSTYYCNLIIKSSVCILSTFFCPLMFQLVSAYFSLEFFFFIKNVPKILDIFFREYVNVY